VSAALFLVETLPTGSRYVLSGPEGHHAADVQRVRIGEMVTLTDGRGGAMSAAVAGVGKGTVELTITDVTYLDPPNPRLVVVQGLPKGDRGELAVQAMTETGVDEILPWAAARSVTQWRGPRGDKARDKWAVTAREAAKQSRRPWIPRITGVPDCSTRQVAARIEDAEAAFVLHEDATGRLTSARLPRWGEIIVVIGPEGGISDAEMDIFLAARAVPVRLGAEVLRTSTAGVAALSVLSAMLGRW
jgi:16S rRNA (uracil1498-N3)-methyltransferase